jgi:UDP-glucose 4-epimerase
LAGTSSDLDGCRVLVTGATGLIGAYVVEGLVARGAAVHAVSRFDQPPRPGVEWRRADLSDEHVVTDLFEATSPDYVFHLAVDARVERRIDLVLPTIRHNLMATIHVLIAATTAGCRRVVTSGSVLGEPAPTTSEPVPASPYGATRWATNGYSRMFHAIFDTPVVTLRPTIVYGPGHRDMSRLIPYVITELQHGRTPELTSGTRVVDTAFVADVAAAYVAAANAPGIDGMTIDVGSGVSLTVRELVEHIHRVVAPQAAPPVFGQLPERPLDQHVTVDPAPAEQLLGWRATTDLETGLVATAEWIASLGAGPS